MSRTVVAPAPAPYADLQVNDAAVMPDGDVLVVGYARHELDSAHEQNDALVVRVDPSGVVRSAFAVGGPRGDRANAVAVQPDGTFAISGETVVGSTAQPWVAVLTTDDQGTPTLQSSSHYLDEPANELPSAYSIATGIAAVDGGDFVVAGYTGLHGHRDGWLLRVDPSGMPVWSKRFIGTEDDELTGVIAMAHGVAAFGHTRTSDPDGSFDDIWIVRSNVDGMVHFADDSGFETVNGDAQWQFVTDHQLLELSMSPTSPAFDVAITDTTVTTSPAQAVERDLT